MCSECVEFEAQEREETLVSALGIVCRKLIEERDLSTQRDERRRQNEVNNARVRDAEALMMTTRQENERLRNSVQLTNDVRKHVLRLTREVYDELAETHHGTHVHETIRKVIDSLTEDEGIYE